MRPHILNLPKLGTETIGFLSVAEIGSLPFDIKRVYWTYDVPADVLRGHHAHHELEQLIMAVHGTIAMELESVTGEKETFVLEHPWQALYIPRLYWRTITFSEQAVLLCLASMEYGEEDYIRDYAEFKRMQSGNA